MQTAIKKLYTLLKNDNTLKGYLGGTSTDSKIYPAISDSFEKFPCIMYSVVNEPYRTVPHGVQDLTFEIQIFSKTDKQMLKTFTLR